ncbi:MAG: hypothetical protein K6A94_00690 [Bacteroidales bacterium]|nr:hypothetical protein [Bacteroidales bacterium]
MLTLEYLQNRLNGQLKGISKPSAQIIESAGGYDGIVALVQTKNLTPVIILEDSEVGEFSFQDGGFLRSSQSIWVMKMVAKEENRNKIQNECFNMMKHILSILAVHDEDDECMKNWVWGSVPWGVRNAGANYTGYEFTLHFSEDTDLSYNE